MTVRTVKVIVATNATMGLGKENDPIRKLFQIYTMDGQIVLEIDTMKKELKVFADGLL